MIEVEQTRKIFQHQKEERARLFAQIEIDATKIQEAHIKLNEITNIKK